MTLMAMYVFVSRYDTVQHMIRMVTAYGILLIEGGGVALPMLSCLDDQHGCMEMARLYMEGL